MSLWLLVSYGQGARQKSVVNTSELRMGVVT